MRIHQLSDADRHERNNKIQKLRDLGLETCDIAERLSLTVANVGRILRKVKAERVNS